MPSFEFVIPDSFFFVPANLSFISFCFFISFIFYKLFNKSKLVFLFSLLGLFSIVYHDVFTKYAVEKYYSFVKSEPLIYSYPIKNEEGKIESLASVRLYGTSMTSLSNLSSKQKEYIVDVHEEYIDKFLDVPVYTYKFNKYKYVEERFFLNFYKYDDSFIENKNEKARYKIYLAKKESLFPNLYKEFEYRFFDTQTDTVLATAYLIKFENSMDKIRNKFLYWTKEKEEMFSFSNIENFDLVYKKLFIDERDY